MQIKQFFSSSVDGCPGNVTVTCLGARRPLSFVSLNGVVLSDGLRSFSREDFSESEDMFSVIWICTAEQSNIISTPVTITVTARALSCAERLSCWLVIVIICIAALVAVCILLAVIACICIMCKKKKNSGNGSEKLKEKELDEKL
jgi:hypothetical protein